MGILFHNEGNIDGARVVQRVSYYFGAVTCTLSDASIDTFSADFIIEFAKSFAQLSVDGVNVIVADNDLQALFAL